MKNTQDDHNRRIIHVDMDAFFASVEQRDNPELLGQAVIVGGQPNSRGVVAACSYEARKFGVHSAMPCSQAARLCPNAHYIKPNIAKYREVSQQIHSVFREHTDLIEPLSLDEAYLDVSDADLAATEIAKTIKQQIKDRLDLVASAGVSYNKFLAKLASDMDKPDGLFIIRPKHAQSIIDNLAIRKFHGIGPATEKKMIDLGIQTGIDLRRTPIETLQQHFKSSAQYYHNIAHGIDNRSVQTDRKRVSIGRETTFSDDISDESLIKAQLEQLASQVMKTLKNKELSAQSITLKFKFSDFTQITRSKTLQHKFDHSNWNEVRDLIKALIVQAELNGRRVRLLGVSFAKLSAESNEIDRQMQFSLFK